MAIPKQVLHYQTCKDSDDRLDSKYPDVAHQRMTSFLELKQAATFCEVVLVQEFETRDLRLRIDSWLSNNESADRLCSTTSCANTRGTWS